MMTDDEPFPTLEERLEQEDDRADAASVRARGELNDEVRTRNAIARLIRAEVERQEVEREIAYRVRRVRALGGSWTAVGHALGVSKQSAQRKYSDS